MCFNVTFDLHITYDLLVKSFFYYFRNRTSYRDRTWSKMSSLEMRVMSLII